MQLAPLMVACPRIGQPSAHGQVFSIDPNALFNVETV
jgi:hypothetical protein